MLKIKKLVIFLLSISLMVSCHQKKENQYKKSKLATSIDWKNTQTYYLDNMNKAVQLIDTLYDLKVQDSLVLPTFFKLRAAFKKAEPYVGYLNPEVAHRANGPALPIFREDSGKVVSPIGLQKLEEIIVDADDQFDYWNDLYILKGFLVNLRNAIQERDLNAQRFFIATHQQLMRVASLSTSGFDTPVTGKSIREIAVSLESLYDVYELSIQKIIVGKNKELDSRFKERIDKAIKYVLSDVNFEHFDRYTFIKDYLNAITRDWVLIRQESGLWNGKTNAYPFNFDAPTFFEEDSFNVNFFLNINDRNSSEDRIALGEKLFFDKNLSTNGTMSCATCHNPKKAYSDGLKLGFDNSGEKLSRNAPTLINAIYQKAFFWDGRAHTIEDQINSVFTNRKEFNTKIHEFSGDILQDSSYVSMFKKAYGGVPKKNKEVIRALSVYVSTLKGFSSKFDKNIRAEESTFSNSEKKGFNLFMGKALCATCHFLPLTNGTVPPFYTETEKEVIGVSKTAKNKQVDNDRGFYWVHEEEIHDKMFKTPTLRNIALTAPYMHNGVYNTLEEVMNFYNKGGGAGLGFDLPHQTLPFDHLDLSEQEIQDIIAFMKTLTDSY